LRLRRRTTWCNATISWRRTKAAHPWRPSALFRAQARLSARHFWPTRLFLVPGRCWVRGPSREAGPCWERGRSRAQPPCCPWGRRLTVQRYRWRRPLMRRTQFWPLCRRSRSSRPVHQPSCRRRYCLRCLLHRPLRDRSRRLNQRLSCQPWCAPWAAASHQFHLRRRQHASRNPAAAPDDGRPCTTSFNRQSDLSRDGTAGP